MITKDEIQELLHSTETYRVERTTSTGYMDKFQEEIWNRIANGSPRATFETTEDRLTFLIHIPVHTGCGNKPSTETATEKSGKTTEKIGSTTEKIGSTTEKTTEKANKTTEKTAEKIVRLMKENPQITNKELADACGITEDGVYWNTKKLRKNNTIRRVGGDKGGHWEVIN